MSHKLTAKNKETGEVVEVGISSLNGSPIYEPNGTLGFSEHIFNELYEVVEEEIPPKEIREDKTKLFKWAAKDFDKRFTGVMKELAEEETPEWEEKFDKEFTLTKEEKEEGWHLSRDCIKQFIKDTLQKERDRIVAKIKIQIEFTRRSPNLRPVNQAAYIIEGLQKAIIIIENK